MMDRSAMHVIQSAPYRTQHSVFPLSAGQSAPASGKHFAENKDTGLLEPLPLHTIDDVIAALATIIWDSEQRHDPLGYFAVLYQKVTIKVKEGIANNFFDDGPRMEQLDIVFAERYLAAYFAYQQGQPLSYCWKKAFDLGSVDEPIVLQHLLLGINAHINLDLGIAAAEVCAGEDIRGLKNDFIKINEILASLVDEVMCGLSGIWPFYGLILERAGKFDNLLVDLVMRAARISAWKFAKKLAKKPAREKTKLIARRDRQTARKAKFIGRPGTITSMMLRRIRQEERGSVSEKLFELSVPAVAS
ncbi:DUF5995 family protein [Flavilitoribacter nigricans]|uniref:DUF5995 family protein n=1 Tax=Flavilitoribacter nigricans TaxID=70997 RepID=UPI001C9E3DBD|nr:DUF5995 family protein [Flavilitoribacter nigricans]